jgi:predicted oxidoreductase
MATGSVPHPSLSLLTEGAARLALGTMRLLDWGLEARALATHLRQVAEAGVRVLDTADIYGGGAVEPALGRAFREDPALRRSFRIVGKCGIRLRSAGPDPVAVKHYDTSRAHVTAQVERSLGHLGVERLDLLLIHRPDPLMDAAELAHAAASLLAEGKIAAFGVSNFAPAQADLLQSRLATPLAAHQIEASLWHPAPLLDGTLDHAQRHGLLPMAWSPLGGGRPAQPALGSALADLGRAMDLGPAQVALAWLARHPAGVMPVLGTGRLDRVREAVSAMDRRLDREAWFALLEAATGHPVA